MRTFAPCFASTLNGPRVYPMRRPRAGRGGKNAFLLLQSCKTCAELPEHRTLGFSGEVLRILHSGNMHLIVM